MYDYLEQSVQQWLPMFAMYVDRNTYDNYTIMSRVNKSVLYKISQVVEN